MRDVDILISVVVEVGPAGTHARANIFNVSRAGNRSESSVAIVAIQVVSTKVVCHVQIRQTIGDGLAPRTSEAVAVVIRVQSSRCRPLYKPRVPLVMQQAISWSIARVEIGSWIVILI